MTDLDIRLSFDGRDVAIFYDDWGHMFTLVHVDEIDREFVGAYALDCIRCADYGLVLLSLALACEESQAKLDRLMFEWFNALPVEDGWYAVDFGRRKCLSNEKYFYPHVLDRHLADHCRCLKEWSSCSGSFAIL